MNLKMLKDMAMGTEMFTSLPFNLLSSSLKCYVPVRTESAWEEERKDILERANWLCDKIIVEPETLLKQMPAMLGKFYGGQWAIYSCSMLSAALANIAVLYPDTRERCVTCLNKLVKITLSPAIRAYDTMAWKEDALETLSGNKSHMTYLSILSWVITNYKMTGGGTTYDSVLHACCEAMNRRMLQTRDLNLLSFPNKPVFFPDMLFAIVALHNYSQFYDGKYGDSVENWIEKAKSEWLNQRNGLLASMLKHNSRPIRGSYTALNCYCLTLIDREFAYDQYLRMKHYLRKDEPVTGIKEYLIKSPKFKLDVDAGPIIMGLSPSGTTFALGSATYFGDWEFRNQILRSADIATETILGEKQRHYRLGELFIVGEAAALAMRTNVPR